MILNPAYDQIALELTKLWATTDRGKQDISEAYLWFRKDLSGKMTVADVMRQAAEDDRDE